MRRQDAVRLLLVGVLASACCCSKVEKSGADKQPAPSRVSTPAAAAADQTAAVPSTNIEPARTNTSPTEDDDVADLMDDGDPDNAGVASFTHKSSGTAFTLPEQCDPTTHTERERVFDCPGWTIHIRWIATPIVPANLPHAAATALPDEKRRVISTTRRAGGYVLLTDRADGSRAFEGWFHHQGKLVYLQARAPRATFKALSPQLQLVAGDFVAGNTSAATP